MSEHSLYETVVSREGLEPPRPKVRASAAVVLWRRDPSGALRVFWMRRDPAMRFMGGWHAFPGGAVSREDASAEAGSGAPWFRGAPPGLDDRAVTGAMPETLTAGLDPLPPDRVPGLLTATFRELFEETGLLPVAEGATGAAPERLEEARRDLVAKRTSFPETLGRLARRGSTRDSPAEGGLVLDASRLVFAGRWLTPPFAPLRFDNRFFLLEHRPGEPEPSVPDEADEAGWIEPREALELWRRGEVIAAPPILHLLRVLADDGVEGGLQRLRHPEEVNLGPFRRIEFRPGVVMLPLATPTLPPATHTNAYLLAPPGGGETVLVDPGTPFDREGDQLEDALEAAAAAGHPLGAIWLTHHHPDHVGAVARLAERFRVPVAAHAATAQRLEPRGIRVDRTLEDEERIAVGPLSVRVLHTPGHARGHLCFLEEGLGSLLAGDVVSAVSTIVIDPPEGDMDDYLASLERLAGVGARTLFPGHGPAIVRAQEALRELVEHRLHREERILRAWRSGVRTPADMLPTVYDDAPRQAWPLAERQIEAHLVRLARSGEIEREEPVPASGPRDESGGAA